MVLSDDLRGAYGVGTWVSALVGVGYDGVRWTAGAIWMIVMPKNRGRRIRKDVGGRYKIRTCDPFRVREVRYHCANRPGMKKTAMPSGMTASHGADNGTRTRGLNLGKVALYQLSYVRKGFPP